MAHTITHTTATGRTETLRLYGAPDCDMAAMFVANKFGSKVTKVVVVENEGRRVWGEMDIGEYA